MQRRRVYILFFFLIMLTLGVSISVYTKKWEWRSPELEVHFFALKRGRSIFIRTPEGKTVLIDGGQNSGVVRELTGAFPFYRKRIDVVIATTALPKNIGGLSDVLTRFDVGKVIEPVMIGTSTARDAFEKIRKRKRIELEEVHKGQTIEVGSFRFEVLWPDPDFKFNKNSTPELVIAMTHGDKKFVFFGDVSKAVQNIILKDIRDIYVAEFAHSATKSRVTADLLSTLRPDMIVSSGGERTKIIRLK